MRPMITTADMPNVIDINAVQSFEERSKVREHLQNIHINNICK